jgi:hypothetical protein
LYAIGGIFSTVVFFFAPSRREGYVILFDTPGTRARTAAYFSLVGKVGKSTPEPAVLDSLLGDASGMTSAGDFRTRLQMKSCDAP